MKELNLLRFHKMSLSEIHKELASSKEEPQAVSGKKKTKSKISKLTRLAAAAVIVAALAYAVIYYWPTESEISQPDIKKPDVVTKKDSDEIQPAVDPNINQNMKKTDSKDVSDEKQPELTPQIVVKRNVELEKKGYVKFGDFEFLDDNVPDVKVTEPLDKKKTEKVEEKKEEVPVTELAKLKTEPKPRKVEVTREIYKNQPKKKVVKKVKPAYLKGDYFVQFGGVDSKGYYVLKKVASANGLKFTVAGSATVGQTDAWAVYKVVSQSKTMIAGKPVKLLGAYTSYKSAMKVAKKNKPVVMKKIRTDVKKYDINLCCVEKKDAEILADKYKLHGNITKILKYMGK